MELLDDADLTALDVQNGSWRSRLRNVFAPYLMMVNTKYSWTI